MSTGRVQMEAGESTRTCPCGRGLNVKNSRIKPRSTSRMPTTTAVTSAVKEPRKSQVRPSQEPDGASSP
ncbi:DUF1922 domain-containing protein [Corynebacterium afermentans subsp. lipophilum]|nr:DUF1922 domain-containing protein [Corynebacterium afermentans subsp. lipophilum]